jgi:hypothetical protein
MSAAIAKLALELDAIKTPRIIRSDDAPAGQSAHIARQLAAWTVVFS